MDPSEVLTEYFINLLHETHFNPSQDNTDSRGGNMLQLLQLSRVVVPLYKVDGLFSPLLSSPLLSFLSRMEDSEKRVIAFSFFFLNEMNVHTRKRRKLSSLTKHPRSTGIRFSYLFIP